MLLCHGPASRPLPFPYGPPWLKHLHFELFFPIFTLLKKILKSRTRPKLTPSAPSWLSSLCYCLSWILSHQARNLCTSKQSSTWSSLLTSSPIFNPSHCTSTNLSRSPTPFEFHSHTLIIAMTMTDGVIIMCQGLCWMFHSYYHPESPHNAQRTRGTVISDDGTEAPCPCSRHWLSWDSSWHLCGTKALTGCTSLGWRL